MGHCTGGSPPQNSRVDVTSVDGGSVRISHPQVGPLVKFILAVYDHLGGSGMPVEVLWNAVGFICQQTSFGLCCTIVNE